MDINHEYVTQNLNHVIISSYSFLASKEIKCFLYESNNVVYNCNTRILNAFQISYALLCMMDVVFIFLTFILFILFYFFILIFVFFNYKGHLKPL